ncbi:MAG: hypothetical protein H0V73_10200 [Chloroflexi bacterium]|nr:hypothetical protein [Chloroflexota bacterium]
MPFPFLPLGAVVAASVLCLVLLAFGLALKAMDRAASRAGAELRLSMLPDLVSGFRGWAPGKADGPRPSGSPLPSPDSSSGGPEIVELDGREPPLW